MTFSVRATSERVLGTAIFDVDGGGRDAVVLSDLHVPHGGSPVVAWLADVLLRAGRSKSRVFVLGDLFDTYVTPKQLRAGICREVAGLFADCARQGASVAMLHGNRDFLVGREWTDATGCAVIGGGIRTVLGGAKALLLHGDELCVRDLPYQRAKAWLRRPLVKALARSLPLSLAEAAARRARAKSRMVIQAGDQSRFLPTHDAIAAAFATGVGLLVFGHIHRRAMGKVGGGSYRVLPAFDEAGVCLHAGEGLTYVDRTGAPLPSEPQALPGC
jgi:UDP-2,3-diacylglucosamine hydrolase